MDVCWWCWQGCVGVDCGVSAAFDVGRGEVLDEEGVGFLLGCGVDFLCVRVRVDFLELVLDGGVFGCGD